MRTTGTNERTAELHFIKERLADLLDARTLVNALELRYLDADTYGDEDSIAVMVEFARKLLRWEAQPPADVVALRPGAE